MAPNDSPADSKVKAQGTGASVRVEGQVVESPAKGAGSCRIVPGPGDPDGKSHGIPPFFLTLWL